MAEPGKNQVATQAATAAPTETRHGAMTQFIGQLDNRLGELAGLLQGMDVAKRFVSVVKNALLKDPELLNADRTSLFQACVQLATYRVNPDGKQAALVIYSTKVKDANGREQWIKKVQAMVMVKGIVEILYRTGRVQRIITDVIYDGEFYDITGGDAPSIKHKPSLEIRNEDNPKIIASYCIVETKDGVQHMRALSKKKIAKAKAASKSDNVWSKYEDEMSIKTAIHSLSKTLPFEELKTVVANEESFYDFTKVQAAVPVVTTVALTHNPADDIPEAPTNRTSQEQAGREDAHRRREPEQQQGNSAGREPVSPPPTGRVEPKPEQRSEPENNAATGTPIEPRLDTPSDQSISDADRAAAIEPEGPADGPQTSQEGTQAPSAGLIANAIKRARAAKSWDEIVQLLTWLRDEKIGPWEAAIAIDQDHELYAAIRDTELWANAFPGDPFFVEVKDDQ